MQFTYGKLAIDFQFDSGIVKSIQFTKKSGSRVSSPLGYERAIQAFSVLDQVSPSMKNQELSRGRNRDFDPRSRFFRQRSAGGNLFLRKYGFETKESQSETIPAESAGSKSTFRPLAGGATEAQGARN
jgi:hypothetical protein